jgi:hypothetical protein
MSPSSFIAAKNKSAFSTSPGIMSIFLAGGTSSSSFSPIYTFSFFFNLNAILSFLSLSFSLVF